jgi:hypothetical protein
VDYERYVKKQIIERLKRDRKNTKTIMRLLQVCGAAGLHPALKYPSVDTGLDARIEDRIGNLL